MNSRRTVALLVCPPAAGRPTPIRVCERLALSCLPFLALLLMPAQPMHAQIESAALLTVDSPELYETFFRFQDDLNRWAGERKAAIGQIKAQALDDAIARHFSLNPGDIAKLTVVTQSVMKDLRQIDAEMWSYRNARAKYKQLPEVSIRNRMPSAARRPSRAA